MKKRIRKQRFKKELRSWLMLKLPINGILKVCVEGCGKKAEEIMVIHGGGGMRR